MRINLPMVLAGIGAVLLIPAMIDPLEGGMILMVATAFLLIASIVARVSPLRSVWIPLLVAFAIGAATIMASSSIATDTRPVIQAAVWAYRAGVLLALIGTVRYAMALGHAMPHEPTVPHAPQAM